MIQGLEPARVKNNSHCLLMSLNQYETIWNNTNQYETIIRVIPSLILAFDSFFCQGSSEDSSSSTLLIHLILIKPTWLIQLIQPMLGWICHAKGRTWNRVGPPITKRCSWICGSSQISQAQVGSVWKYLKYWWYNDNTLFVTVDHFPFWQLVDLTHLESCLRSLTKPSPARQRLAELSTGQWKGTKEAPGEADLEQAATLLVTFHPHSSVNSGAGRSPIPNTQSLHHLPHDFKQ